MLMTISLSRGSRQPKFALLANASTSSCFPFTRNKTTSWRACVASTLGSLPSTESLIAITPFYCPFPLAEKNAGGIPLHVENVARLHNRTRRTL